jgi:cell division inhibitor SepF
MGLWQGFKSLFFGEDEIEREEYASYRPPVSEPQSEPVREEKILPAEEVYNNRAEEEQRPKPQPEPTPVTQTAAPSNGRRNQQERRTQNGRNNIRNNANSVNNRNNTSNQESEVNMATTAQSSFDLVLARPNNYRDVNAIGDDLNAGRTVILNLEMVKQEDATRILDFLSGVAYANNDEIKMMAQKTYAIMPQTVNFSGVDLVSELENNGYNF